MQNQGFARYLELVRKVDVFADSVKRAAGNGITCRRGCDECCTGNFSVYRVEGQNLSDGFMRLPASSRKSIMARCSSHDPSSSTCVLLENGVCVLYEQRPIICRTHGLPVTSNHISVNGTKRTSICPKNFSVAGSIESLADGYVLNLDTLNAVLAAVNMLYVKEGGSAFGEPDRGERLFIHELFV